MEDDIDSKILRTLLENGSMTCRAIDKATKLNDRMVRRRLKFLQEKGLVDQTRRGRSDCNSLTEKGEDLIIDDVIGTIARDLATLSRIDKKISPGQWKAMKRQGAIINLLFRAREHVDSEKEQALRSLMKKDEASERCPVCGAPRPQLFKIVDRGEVGKRDVVFHPPKDGV
jgi:repressor of nif and glnA expression